MRSAPRAARQLRARALRPLARRRFPSGEPPRAAAPVPGVEELWRSAAFEVSSPPDASTRLGRFHRQYGDDVLAAARAGDLEETRRLVSTWIEAHPPHDGDAWHPYPLSTRTGNWIAALTLAARARVAGALAQPLAPAPAAGAQCRGRRAREPRHPQRARARARRCGVRRARACTTRDRAAPPGAAGAGAPRRRALRAQPRLPPRGAARPARDPGGVAALVARRRDRAHAPLRRRARPARRRAGALQRRHRRRATARAARASRGARGLPRLGLRRRARGRRCGSRSAAGRRRRRFSPRTPMRTRSRSSSGGGDAPSSSIPARSRTSRERSATGSARRARTRR